jgi:hypothetical protein
MLDGVVNNLELKINFFSMKTSTKSTKKLATFLLFGLLLTVIVFSPYTIVKLTSWAGEEDLTTQESEYQVLENQLAELATQEEVLESELASIETVAETTIENAEPEINQMEEPAVFGEENSALPNGEVTDLPFEPVVTENLPMAEEIVEETANNPELITPEPEPEPAFDPAIAPGTVSLNLKIQSGSGLKFPLEIRLVGVGREPIITRSDSQGKVEIQLESGRYYAELTNEKYTFPVTHPAFFLSANSQVDLGEFSVGKK